MKPLVTLIFFTTFFSPARAQLAQHTWLVGGSGSFYSFNEDYTIPTYSQTAKYITIDVAASIGYFLVDKFAAGLRPGFSSEKVRVIRTSLGTGPGSGNSYRVAIGPFARYYFLDMEKPFNILIDASYQMGILQYLGVLHERGKNNTLSIKGGTEIFFNQTAGIEILVGYTQKILSIENSPGAFNNTKSGFQASVGFTIHLEKL